MVVIKTGHWGQSPSIQMSALPATGFGTIGKLLLKSIVPQFGHLSNSDNHCTYITSFYEG